MSIKLLPASVNPVDPSNASEATISLVPPTRSTIATRAAQIAVVPSADSFAWSSSTHRGQPPFIHGTVVENAQSDDTGDSDSEYLSGWGWTHSVESTAIAHYLFYAASLASWSGRLINLYA